MRNETSEKRRSDKKLSETGGKTRSALMEGEKGRRLGGIRVWRSDQTQGSSRGCQDKRTQKSRLRGDWRHRVKKWGGRGGGVGDGGGGGGGVGGGGNGGGGGGGGGCVWLSMVLGCGADYLSNFSRSRRGLTKGVRKVGGKQSATKIL